MLSGIGPAAHLRAVGVDVVADLPGVGANLHDHPLAVVIYAAARPIPPGQNNHGEVFAAVRTAAGLSAPDIQVFLMDVPFHPPWLPGPAAGYTIAFATLHPHSRGSVRLANADPASAPLIDPNYLGDDRDMAEMLTALRVAREIGSSPAFDDWRANETLPGPDVQDPAELCEYLRRDTDPYNHPVGARLRIIGLASDPLDRNGRWRVPRRGAESGAGHGPSMRCIFCRLMMSSADP